MATLSETFIPYRQFRMHLAELLRSAEVPPKEVADYTSIASVGYAYARSGNGRFVRRIASCWTVAGGSAGGFQGLPNLKLPSIWDEGTRVDGP